MNGINQSLYALPHIIIIIKSRKLRYGHTAYKGDISKGHTSFVRKSKGKRPHEKMHT